jgi:hypothetical protein
LPATELALPATETALPATKLALPATELALPATELALPATELALPATELALPATETALPATELALPATETALPATETALPATELALPATETALPATETALPATETALPATELAPLAAGTVPPEVRHAEFAMRHRRVYAFAMRKKTADIFNISGMTKNSTGRKFPSCEWVSEGRGGSPPGACSGLRRPAPVFARSVWGRRLAKMPTGARLHATPVPSGQQKKTRKTGPDGQPVLRGFFTCAW